MMCYREVFQTRLVFGVALICGFLFLSQNAYGSSTISGTVYDKQRNFLSDVDVELLNDYYQQIKRARTDGAGRYSFDGLNDGRYTVKVMAFRYDLEDQAQPVEINTVNIKGTQGTSFQIIDFFMSPRKGGLADSELGVVFAQEVPQEARKLYEKGLKDLADKKTTEGITELNKSLEIFPDYYLALHRLGKELFIVKKYEDAARFFYKAAEINPKSATSYYYLGYSFLNIGKDYNKAALASLNQALSLAPGSPQVLFVLGKAERANNDFENAEKHLLQAKKLSKVSIPEVHKELAQLYGNDLKKYSAAADELETYLKNSNPSDAESKQMKKVISDLRAKAKAQSVN